MDDETLDCIDHLYNVMGEDKAAIALALNLTPEQVQKALDSLQEKMGAPVW